MEHKMRRIPGRGVLRVGDEVSVLREDGSFERKRVSEVEEIDDGDEWFSFSTEPLGGAAP